MGAHYEAAGSDEAHFEDLEIEQIVAEEIQVMLAVKAPGFGFGLVAYL